MEKQVGQLVDLPKIVDPRGNLTVAEQMKEVPFAISRVYWTYDIPGGAHRGGPVSYTHLTLPTTERV